MGFTSFDELFGGSNNETIIGSAGDDVLGSGTGRDHLIGGRGDDTILSIDGGDFLDGGRGKNKFFIEDTTENGGVTVDGSFWWNKWN